MLEFTLVRVFTVTSAILRKMISLIFFGLHAVTFCHIPRTPFHTFILHISFDHRKGTALGAANGMGVVLLWFMYFLKQIIRLLVPRLLASY